MTFESQAETLTRQGDWAELESLAARWSRERPASAEAWWNLSRAAFELGRFRHAMEAFGKVLGLSQRTGASLTTYARIAMHALDFEAAASAMAEAEKLAPDHAELLATRGLLLTYLGRFTEAEVCCRRCLELAPDFAPAYTTLSRLIEGRFSDGETDRLRRMAHEERMPLDHRIPAAFALGHSHDARGEVDLAFRAYAFAHQLCIERNVREGRRYDAAATEARTDRLLNLPDFRVPAGDAGSAAVPLFIVGMPRSGTTLIESVLSAHSRVQSAGERPEMQQILEAFLRSTLNARSEPPASAVMSAWREAYLRDARVAAPVDHMTDKHPLNFEAAGLIAGLFPGSVIVHVRRNPLETALSIYRNEFSKFWMFTDRLEDIGHFYGHYARLVSHWERVLEERFVTIQYEEFAGDFDTAAPALVAACGLEWEEGCRNFQAASRPIATFSAVQARKPVRVHSGTAQKYRAWLGPLTEALHHAGVDPDSGAWLGEAASRR
jgi:tetratricopeptide (TPR) repeat protein